MEDRTAYRPALDHLRWIATFFCTFGHAVSVVTAYDVRSLPARLLWTFGDLSHPALITFFVLSGYLVGGRAWRLIAGGSTSDERWRFVVDRFVRVVIVLWPALLVTGLIAAFAPWPEATTGVGWRLDRQAIVGRMGVEAWAGTAVLLNGLLTPKPPINGPLWSMAFEWSYYVFAAAAIYVAARDRRPLGLTILAYAALLIGVGIVDRPRLLWTLSYWLAGMIASRVRDWRNPILSIGLFCAALLLTCVERQAVWVDTIVALATAALLADRGFRDARAVPILAVRLAGISYSVYAIHWPVQLLVWSCLRSAGRVAPRLSFGLEAAGLVVLLTALSYAAGAALAWCTERHTGRVRAWILGRPSAARMVPEAPAAG